MCGSAMAGPFSGNLGARIWQQVTIDAASLRTIHKRNDIMSAQSINVFFDASVAIRVGAPPGNLMFRRLADLVRLDLINVITTELTVDEIVRHHTDNAFGKLRPLADQGFRALTTKYVELYLPVLSEQSLFEGVRDRITDGVKLMNITLDATVLPIDDVKPSLIFAAYDRGEGLFVARNKKNQFPDAFIFERLKMFASAERPLLVVAVDGDFDAPAKTEDHIELVDSFEELFAKLGLLVEEPDPDWEPFLYYDLMANEDFLAIVEVDHVECGEYTAKTICDSIDLVGMSAFKPISQHAPMLVNAEVSANLGVICQYKDGRDNQRLGGSASVAFYANVQTDETGEPTEVTDFRAYQSRLTWSNKSILYAF